MSEELRVTLVQSNLYWEKPDDNLAMFGAKLSKVHDTDLIVLPEMFTTGFTMNTSLAETMEGQAIEWMKRLSAEKNAVVTGSIMIQENGKFYNRLIWLQPDGHLSWYDKRHLFSLSEEPNVFSRGESHLLVEWKGWRFLPLICYDLRFPIWSRNCHNYDVLLYVANWPQRRSIAWKTLLQARAIENQCYTIGVNRVGDDGNSIYHSGDSAVIDAEGMYLYSIIDIEDITTITLEKQKLYQVRTKLPFLKDMDNFIIKL